MAQWFPQRHAGTVEYLRAEKQGDTEYYVLHVSPQGTSVLPSLLQRSGRLPAEHPPDGAPLRHGRIYVAPPDHHLLLEASEAGGLRMRVLKGPKENRQRPAVDPDFVLR